MESENYSKKENMTPSKKKSFFYGLLLLLAALGLLTAVVTVLVATNNNVQLNEEGSASSKVIIPKGWVSKAANTGVSYSYPSQLEKTYISSRDWLPTLMVLNETYVCNPVGDESTPGIWTDAREIEGRPYCVSTYSEGAAGTIYKNYSYYFPLKEQTGVISFFLGYPQCANYDSPNKEACEKEQAEFDLDALVEQIVKTINLN